MVASEPGSRRILGDRYEIRTLIGHGGMAEVHLGFDTRLNRGVAIKMLRMDLARDAMFLRRFQREAQSAASLNHPNIVAVYDTGEQQMMSADGHALIVPYIVMEYVEGHTVRDLLSDGTPVPIDEAVEITCGILAGLEYAHARGLVHRDIKPGNVMLTNDGKIKVMDFGIARAVADSQVTMTQSNAVVGTAQYLSPEQARGEEVDARSDLYSTGCVLFELLTGQPPFKGDSAVSVAFQHVSQEPPAPKSLAPDIPDSLNQITLKALTKESGARYQTAGQMRQDLLAAVEGLPVSAAAFDETQATMTLAAVPAGAAALGATTVAPQMPPTTPVAGIAVAPPFPGPSAEGIRETEDEKAIRRRQSTTKIIVSLVLVALILVAVAIYLLVRSNQVEQVTIPDNLVGMSQAEVQAALEEIGLVPEIGDEVASDDIEIGLVAKTDPSGGTMVDAGSTVTIHLSSGAQTVNVPELAGMTAQNARSTLEGLGLVYAEGDPVASSEIDEGLVVNYTPSSGTVLVGSTVTVHLSSGPDMVPVPSVLGMSESRACNELENVGLTCQVGDSVTSDSYDTDTVGEVSPGVGESVEPGSTVVIKLVSGSATVVVPGNIVGMTSGEVRSAIESLGLVYQNGGSVDSTRVSAGLVAETNPVGGTRVSVGSTVTVYYASPSNRNPDDPATEEDDPNS